MHKHYSVGKPERRQRHGPMWETISKQFLKNGVGGCRLDSSGLGQGPVLGSCEYSNRLSCFIKGRISL
jgi:hypothetical protein